MASRKKSRLSAIEDALVEHAAGACVQCFNHVPCVSAGILLAHLPPERQRRWVGEVR